MAGPGSPQRTSPGSPRCTDDVAGTIEAALVFAGTDLNTPQRAHLEPMRFGDYMVGDLTYDADLLAAGHVPGAGNNGQMRRAVAAVNTLRQRFPDLTVLTAHDPAAANRLAASLDLAHGRT